MSPTKDHEFQVVVGRMEAVALLKAATTCRKKMLHADDGERPVADLYLQASLKFLHTARLQEEFLLSGTIGHQLEITRNSYLQNYTDGAMTLETCVQIFENFRDYRKAAVCHILLGVPRMKLQPMLPTSPAAICTPGKYNHYSREANHLEPRRTHRRQTAAMHGEPSRSEMYSLQDQHLSQEAKMASPNEPRQRDLNMVELLTSLRSAHERFCEGSMDVPPMPDTWTRANRCLGSAEASGPREDARYQKSLLEVRKFCEMAMFGENFDTFFFQAYVAIDAINFSD
ncbi:hypothetical protein R1flu_025176 [Riccia fluitans]|uniref:Uncharacterized protein n=1 Tax=Riccia fluitans TaxID=41844 RepID=A0ABD1XXF0_9MARC